MLITLETWVEGRVTLELMETPTFGVPKQRPGFSVETRSLATLD